ncbi:MAG: hypothetical protein U5S82_13945 [Gammaproteobacteria bacterium]|nr:hypothetical protein [Gammaproteobacteria bacterium]
MEIQYFKGGDHVSHRRGMQGREGPVGWSLPAPSSRAGPSLPARRATLPRVRCPSGGAGQEEEKEKKKSLVSRIRGRCENNFLSPKEQQFFSSRLTMGATLMRMKSVASLSKNFTLCFALPCLALPCLALQGPMSHESRISICSKK